MTELGVGTAIPMFLLPPHPLIIGLHMPQVNVRQGSDNLRKRYMVPEWQREAGKGSGSESSLAVNA